MDEQPVESVEPADPEDPAEAEPAADPEASTEPAADAEADAEPGGSRRSRLLRALAIVIAAVLVLWLLFTVVFPQVERYLEDPTLGAPATSDTPTTVLSASGRG